MPSLRELPSPADLRAFLAQHAAAGCLVTFSATWCGPCRASRPALEALAARPASPPMALVHEHVFAADGGGDDALAFYRIRAFPTHCLFRGGREADRVEGANMPAVEALLAQVVPTGGTALGGGGGAAAAALSPDEARRRRLVALGGATAAAAASPSAPIVAASSRDGPDADVTMADAEEPAAAEPAATSVVDTAAALAALTQDMGFSLPRAQRALLRSRAAATGSSTALEAAVDWLAAHQDDAAEDLDAPLTDEEQAALDGTGPAISDDTGAADAPKANSYKCNTCGKILSNLANLELHAHQTGHGDFEESTAAGAPPLTAEQKAAKVAQLKALLKAKRAVREAAEQADEVQRERARRLMGQSMAQTREQHEAEQRQREAYLRKKEKQEAARERARIKAELEKDKLERQANKGKLKSKLGVDGYHPDAIQYDVDAGATGVAAAAAATEQPGHGTPQEPKKPKVNLQKIDDYIAKVSSYRAGGDGGRCLKVLMAYVGNVVDHPEEPKFRSINTDNNAFKTRVKPFLGAKQLLLAVGFQAAPEHPDALVLAEPPDAPLLADTRAKLQAALERYG